MCGNIIRSNQWVYYNNDIALGACRTGRLEAGAWSDLGVGSGAYTFVLFLVNT